jgi:hypothetical protein
MTARSAYLERKNIMDQLDRSGISKPPEGSEYEKKQVKYSFFFCLKKFRRKKKKKEKRLMPLLHFSIAFVVGAAHCVGKVQPVGRAGRLVAASPRHLCLSPSSPEHAFLPSDLASGRVVAIRFFCHPFLLYLFFFFFFHIVHEHAGTATAPARQRKDLNRRFVHDCTAFHLVSGSRYCKAHPGKKRACLL